MRKGAKKQTRINTKVLMEAKYVILEQSLQAEAERVPPEKCILYSRRLETTAMRKSRKNLYSSTKPYSGSNR